MLVMTPLLKAPELILSSASDYISEIIEMGESKVLVNGVIEFKSGNDARKWARTHLGRVRSDYTLFLRYPAHIEEHRVEGGKVTELVHPVWNFLERGIDTLMPLLRGEWTGHVAHDHHGNAFEVGPTPGQEGYKVFMSSMPPNGDLAHRTLTTFLTNARSRGLLVPEIYYDSVKALAGGLNFSSDALVYNPGYAARHREVLTCQGRRIRVSRSEELGESWRAIEAVGFSVEDLLDGDVSTLVKFNIASARWAATHWRKDVMPLGPKVLAGGARTATV